MNHKYPIGELESRIGYVFRDHTLLETALTHSSYANERKINKVEDYERLEYLGDAVLELTVSEFLFHNHPEMHEGEMTKTRASLVCEPTLALCAEEISLGDFILLGKGEDATGGRKRESIVSDVFEATIGAIYIDGGFTNAKEFIRRFVLTDMEHKILFFDSKTILQEKVQEQGKQVVYELKSQTGPDHNKTFCVEALIDGVVRAQGSGRTKKAAEQQAAYAILIEMKNNGGN